MMSEGLVSPLSNKRVTRIFLRLWSFLDGQGLYHFLGNYELKSVQIIHILDICILKPGYFMRVEGR